MTKHPLPQFVLQLRGRVESGLFPIQGPRIYSSLTNVDLQSEVLIPEAVWLNALKRVRRAVIHRAVEIKRMHVKRVHTELVDCVSAEEAAKFSMYLNMGKEGDYAISDRLHSAIERAEADLERAKAGITGRASASAMHAAAPPPP